MAGHSPEDTVRLDSDWLSMGQGPIKRHSQGHGIGEVEGQGQRLIGLVSDSVM